MEEVIHDYCISINVFVQPLQQNIVYEYTILVSAFFPTNTLHVLFHCVLFLVFRYCRDGYQFDTLSFVSTTLEILEIFLFFFKFVFGHWSRIQLLQAHELQQARLPVFSISQACSGSCPWSL